MTPVHIATLSGGRANLNPPTVEELAARLKGGLLLPKDRGFDEAVLVWNGMVRKIPALVAQPVDAADVAAVVDFARAHDLLLSVKGGGHNIAGTAVADGGLLLDMSRMRRVQVDPDARTARVGAGCLLQDVDRATQKHGLATVLGFVSEVGVAGLTLGGGLGYLSRRFGWTADNLMEVEIVTADGKIRHANRETHEDLFWAIRGGGGNFGIVTEFVYRLHEVQEIAGGVMAWPAETREQTEAILRAYRHLTMAAPRELTVFCSLRRAPPAPFIPEEWHGRRVALFLICHGGTQDAAARDLTLLRENLGEPIVNAVARRPYAEQQSLLDGAEPKGAHYYWKTEYVANLDDGLLTAVCDLSLENPMNMGEIGFLHIGGALNERAWDDGAVGNRDAQYAVGVLGMWPPDDSRGVEHRAWVRKAWTAIRPFSTGGNYVNFQSADEGEDRVLATYGKNYDRLAEVKRRYDPTNFFRVNRNVAPTGQPSPS